MKRSADYHNYVFKKGKFIGKFDEMYKYSKDVPWHQDKTARYIHSNIDITILKHYRYNSLCELGCGLGYFTNRLYRELSSSKGRRPRVTGIDISPIAIKKSTQRFPGIRFMVKDFVNQEMLWSEKFDLVVIKEVFWYTCHNLKMFMQNAVSAVKKDGFLFVSQCFPEADKWVGQKVIDSPERLQEILTTYANPIYCCIEKDWNYGARPLIHFLGRLKEDANK